MKIYACVKQVPDTAASIRLVGEAGFDPSVKSVMNPYDQYGLEQAVRVKEAAGGEVVAVSVGSGEAIQTLRGAMAVGADRGVLVKTDTVFLDSGITAEALKRVMQKDGQADLIFTGKQSSDSEGMQTHYRLGAALDVPVANAVVSFSIEKDRAIVECEVGGGEREVLELVLPCVIGAAKGLNEPRNPKLPDIMKAKKKPVLEVTLSELGIEDSAGASKVILLSATPERGAAKMLKGSVASMVDDLLKWLRDKEKVL